MATVHITIPDPVITSGHFDYIIKNTVTGATVLTGAATNTPFDVTLPAGSYELLTTYSGYTNGWCFEVVDCNCPVYLSSVITSTLPGINYLEISFDMSGGFPSCPFQLMVTAGSATTSYVISTLLDLVLVSGTTYKYVVFIGSAASVTWQVTKLGSFGGAICAGSTVAYSCLPAQFTDPHHSTSFHLTLVKISGLWYMRFQFWSCGTSCHTFTLHFEQNYIAPGYETLEDIQNVTITLNCGDPSPWQTDVPLSPTRTFWQGQAALDPSDPAFLWLAYYRVLLKDCCGNVAYSGAVYTSPFGNLP